MKSRNRLAALSALATACGPVVASATVLFSDNFDAGTSLSRYVGYAQDNDTDVEPAGALADLANPGGYDVAANFNFNYGAYTYFYTSADGNENASAFIPQAPRSTGAAKVGLRLDVNNALPGNSAVLNLYPKLSEYVALPSGDHKLTFDMWMNYTGPYEGNLGSMEFFTAGVNQAGGGIGGLIPVGNPDLDGFGLAINGERTNTLDYRFYRNNTRLGSLDAETGYVAQDEGTGNPGPADGRNQFYQQLFPFVNPNDPSEAWYETPGSIGKHWTTIEIKVEDGIVYYYAQPAGAAQPTLIGARTDESVTSGQVMFGYADVVSGIAALDTRNSDPAQQDANFGIFDNIVVETTTQTRPKWNVNADGNWSGEGNWLNAVPNSNTATADFTDAISGGSKTINVDGAQTVRAIVFDNASNSYMLADGGGSINFDSLTTGILGTVKVKSGSHTIAAPINSTRNMWFDAAAGSTLNVSGPLNISGLTLRKSGAGDVVVKNLRTGNVTVAAGKLGIAPDGTAAGTSNIADLSIAADARLDLNDNKLITTAAPGSATAGVYDGLQREVQRAYNFTSWDQPGLTTSMAAARQGLTTIGISTGAQIRGLAETDTAMWGGQTITGASTLAMYTYAGDANLDGQIDAGDYGIIDNFVQIAGASGYGNGDFNYDGFIDAGDYGIIDNNVQAQGAPFPTSGSSAGLSGVTAVPEPGSLSVLGLAAVGLFGRRRRRLSGR